jgi:transposase
MDGLVKLLDDNLTYLKHETHGDYVEILVCSSRTEVSCPFCGTPSSRVHSRYKRSFQDLPLQKNKVHVILINCIYFCDNPECTHKRFAERFTCLKPKAKKSERLIDAIIDLSLEVSSVTASKILGKNVADVCKSSICAMLQKKSN